MDDALAGDITLCIHSATFSIQNFSKPESAGIADIHSGIRYVGNRVIGNLGTSISGLLLCAASLPPPHGIHFDQCRLAESGHRYSRRIALSHQSGLVEMAGLAAFPRRRTLLKEETS